MTKPVLSTQADGKTPAGVNERSGCDGGTAFNAFSQAPFTIDGDLYGYAAVRIAGLREEQWCGKCYQLEFTGGPLTGKTMTVLATNTGGDLKSNHFDIAIPGGGVGMFAEGCKRQFPAFDLGQQFGGVRSAADCERLPDLMRPGCKWRFNDFMGADNPPVKFKPVSCPDVLLKNI
jgi:hypothetical protein